MHSTNLNLMSSNATIFNEIWCEIVFLNIKVHIYLKFHCNEKNKKKISIKKSFQEDEHAQSHFSVLHSTFICHKKTIFFSFYIRVKIWQGKGYRILIKMWHGCCGENHNRKQ